MRTRSLMRTALIVGALAIVFPSTARAGTIVLNNDFFGSNVHYEFYGELRTPVTLGSVTMSDGAGLTTELNSPNSFEAYCVDINTDVYGSAFGLPNTFDLPATYNASVAPMSTWTDPPTGTPSPQPDGLGDRRAAWLYNEYAATFTPTQLDERTALQLAIWNVLYDSDFSVSPVAGGNVFVSLEGLDPLNPLDQVSIANYTTIATLANVYLTAAAVADVSTSDAAWLKLTYSNPDPNIGTVDAQDFIGPAAKAVPEPGSLLLLGTGFATITAFRSRRLKRRT